MTCGCHAQWRASADTAENTVKMPAPQKNSATSLTWFKEPYIPT